MVTAFTGDELALLRSLVAKELKELLNEEPDGDLLFLKGEAGYEDFLKDLLAKLGAGKKQA